MIVVGCPIILPRESESVLLGAAILGAVAARKYSSLNEAMRALNAAGQVWFFLYHYSSLIQSYFFIFKIGNEVRKVFKLSKELEHRSGVKLST